MNSFFKRFFKFLLISFIINFSSNLGILSEDLINIEETKQSLNKNINHEETSSVKNQYLLDSGDILKIHFEGLEIFNGEYLVDKDGYLLLPEIKKYKVRNKTLTEVKSELVDLYKESVNNPIIDIEIYSFRKVSVYISGEVSQPGLYKLDEDDPRLFYALKTSKGFTNYSDLSKVKIVRKNSIKNGGGKIFTEINFLKLLLEGDQSFNIRIFDGDYISVPKSQNNLKEQILTINRSNLTPDSINIYVTGNVLNSGKFIVNQGSTLLQAISQTGGKKLLTGKIEFIRFNTDGSVSRNLFNYDPNAFVNSEKNPILMNGDIINVRRTFIGNTAEVLKEATSPFLSIYGLIELLD